MGIKTIKAKSLVSKTTPSPEKAIQRTPKPGEVVRIDSWENALSGLNVLGSDKRMMAQPVLSLIDWNTAEIMWRSDDMAARVIEAIPYEECREGFELVADEQEEEETSPVDPNEDPNAPPGEEDPAADPTAEEDPAPALDPEAPPPKAKPFEKTDAFPPADPKAPAKFNVMTGEALKPGESAPVLKEGEVGKFDPQTGKPVEAAPAGVPASAPNPGAEAKPGDPKPEAGKESSSPAPAPGAAPAEGDKEKPADPNAVQPPPPGTAKASPEGAGQGGQSPLSPDPKPGEKAPGNAGAAPVAGKVGTKAKALKKGKDPFEELQNALEDDLGLNAKLYEARTQARAYGGAAWLLGADDGERDMSKPLVSEKVKKFDWMNVLHPRELSPCTWYGDPMAPKYGEIETYYLTPDSSDGLGRLVGTQIIHETRIVRFDGVVVSKRHRREGLNGWGDSILTRVWEVIRDFQSTWASTGVLMQDFSQTIFKMKGLAQLVASEDPNDQNAFRNRVRAVDYSRSVLNSVMIDADGEDFERKSTTLTGYPDLLDKYAVRLAAAAETPLMILMGYAPSGLNATGDNEMRQWYDKIKARQRKEIEKPIKLVATLKATAMGLKLPDEWSVKFPPLWQLPAGEEATRRKTIVEMVKLAIDAQMITPEEGAISLFGGSKFSDEIRLATQDRNAMKEEREAADAEAAQMNLEAIKAGGGKPGFGGKPGGGKPPGKPGGFGGSSPGFGKPGGGFGKKPGGFK